MLTTIFPNSPSQVEGYVLSVDPTRKVCSVQSIDGRIFKSVQWTLTSGGINRAGVHTVPGKGDRVLISTSLSYPILLGFLPSVSDGSEKPVTMLSSNPIPDLGDTSQIGSETFLDPCGPKDQVSGDHVVTSDGGALFGVLRGGSVIAKAGPLAEVFLSRINSLVRVVSRNWEHFTDSFVDVARNFGGRAFRFTGYSDTPDNVRKDVYLHYEVRGDVAAGEAAKWSYNGMDVSSLPNPSAVLFKRATLTSSGEFLAFQTWSNTGNLEQKVQSSNGMVNSDLTQKDSEFRVVTTDGTQGTLSVKGDTLLLDVDGKGTVRVKANEVFLNVQGVTATVSPSQVQISAQGSTGLYEAGQISLQTSGHGVKVTSAGVDLF